MKKIILLITAISITLLTSGQRSVDNLFRKYAGTDGYVTVTVNGNLLGLVKLFEYNEDSSGHIRHTPEITEVRILTREEDARGDENFYDMVMKDVRRDNYEEFMKVNEKDHDLVMLVRSEGTNFKEFLLVAGGENNFLIQIKGTLTMKDAKRISDDFRHDHDMNHISYHN